MPDHDRKPAFLHTLRQDPEGGAATRCPSCRSTGVTFQDDCVCCGREVVVKQVSEADDLSNSVKALRIKSEEPNTLQSESIPPYVQESKSAIPVAAAGPRVRSSNGRQRRCSISILRPGVAKRYGSLGQLHQQNPGDHLRSVVRIYNQYAVGQSSSSSSSSSSSWRAATRGSSRGGAGRGTAGAHPTYKGVRTRRGVKGYLVEIRPPKWKKTIWLGTYNTSLEAAGAYDAGVFYTKKSNTKYNFDISEGAFPPLPAHLGLDRPDNMDDFKQFVQSQAKLAARRIGDTGNMLAGAGESQNPVVEPSSSGSKSCLTGGESPNSVTGNADHHTASEFEQLPMDLDFLGQCLHDKTVAEEVADDMFRDYTNYVSRHAGSSADQDFQILSDEER